MKSILSVSLNLLVVAALVVATMVRAAETRSLETWFETLKSFSAEFRQTVISSEGEKLQQAHGRVWLEKPGHFRWDYDAPFRQSLLGDGKNIWSYDPELEQAVVKPFAGFKKTTPAVLLNGAGDLKRLFDISKMPSDGDAHIFELIPKNPDDEIRKVRIGFSGSGTPQLLEFTDALGQSTRIRFEAPRKNPKLDPATFVFTPPANIDVIGAPL